MQFRAQAAHETGSLRPDRAISLFSAFSRELELKGFGELEITSP